MQTQLSDLTIRTLQPGTHWDTDTRGLGLRVGKNSRTFIVLVGSGKRKTLGRYPHLSLKDARRECARAKAEVTLGKMYLPRTAFDDAVADFLNDCESRIRPRTLKNYRDYLAFFPYGRRGIGDVTARDILTTLHAQTPSQREHAYRVVRTFFRWCLAQHLIDRSPMENMRPVPLGRARTRVLSSEELGAVYRTARASQGTFGSLVALLALTGQRRGEMSRLEWSWIQGDTIEFPAHVTKNGRVHSVPIGPEAQHLLTGINKMVGSHYVFPAVRKRSDTTTVFNGWSKAKARFDTECGVADWTLHDLRRTAASGMAALGVPQIVVEKLLNHVSGGTQSPIAQVYNRYTYLPEMRDAVLKWERFVTTS